MGVGTATTEAAPVGPSPTLSGHILGVIVGLIILLTLGVAAAMFVIADLMRDLDRFEMEIDADVQAIREQQAGGEARTYRTQALTCSIKLAIGGDLSGDAACQDPNVLELYDEHAQPVVAPLGTGDG